MLQEQKKVATVEFKPNEVVAVALPMVHITTKYQLRLKISVSAGVLAAGETYGTRVVDSPATIIKRVDLRVVPVEIGAISQTIKSISGVDLLKLAQYTLQGTQENVNNIPIGTTSAEGTYTCFGSYDIDFKITDTENIGMMTTDPGTGEPLAIPLTYRPSDMTLFDTRKYNPIDLIITWGDINSLQTGFTAGKLSIVSGSIEVIATEIPQVEAISFLTNRELFKEIAFSGATSDLRVDLPLGNSIRRIMIQAIDNNVYSNALINNVKVIVDETITRLDVGFNQLRNENAKYYKIPFASLLTGVSIVNFDEKRDLQGLLDLTIAKSARISFDVNSPTAGNGKIRIVVQEIVAPAS